MARLVKDPILKKPNCYVIEYDEEDEEEMEELVNGVPKGCAAACCV